MLLFILKQIDAVSNNLMLQQIVKIELMSAEFTCEICNERAFRFKITLIIETFVLVNFLKFKENVCFNEC